MARIAYEQLKSALEESRSVLIAFPYTPDAHLETLDHAAGALSLAKTLEAMGKRVDITASGFAHHPSFVILPGAHTIKAAVPTLHRLVISFPVHEETDATVQHEVHNGELHVAVTPEFGAIDREHIRVRTTSFHYDTLITIGAEDLSALGELHARHGDFLKDVLVINIDHRMSNENYGAINCIDHTSSSSSETITKLLERLSPEIVHNREVATMLLAGLLAATRTFRESHVRPGSLETAGRLVAIGADREKIMNTLFRTRSVAALKLWGRALNNLVHEPSLGLVSAIITQHDFLHTTATPNDLTDVIHELLLASGETDKALLLYEGDNRTIHGILFSRRISPELLLYPELPVSAHARRELRFMVKDKSLETVRQEITEKIAAALAR